MQANQRLTGATLAIGLLAAMACSNGDALPSAPSNVRVPPYSAEDSSWVSIYPGTTIQDVVNRSPGATTFYLRAGAHTQQQVVPKSGNTFVGENGAVMDGQNITAYAFYSNNLGQTNVTIRGLEIKNYTVPDSYFGAITGNNVTNWVVTENVVHDNRQAGIRAGTGAGWQVLRNTTYANGTDGIHGYQCDGALIQDNEVYGNNPANNSTGGESGMKILGAKNLTIRGNNVHDNNGIGIWSDTNYPTVLIENNTVSANSKAGIWHEVSYDAIIRNNIVTGNGSPSVPLTGWIDSAGIQVSNSPNVEIYGNTVQDNANGICIMQGNGYVTTGPYGAYGVRNLYVHDNVVRMAVGRTGLAQNVEDKSHFTSKNNRFVNNIYDLGPNSIYFTWDDKNLTESQWQAYGLDVTGTFTR
jgi:parallel beta-helix repeat protein